MNNKLILPSADYRTFTKGSVISESPTDGQKEVGFISRGTAACRIHCSCNLEPSLLFFLEEGDWISLEELDDEFHETRAAWVAEEVCVIAFLPMDHLGEIQNPTVWASMLASVVKQKAQVTRQVLMRGLPAHRRLEVVLARLSRKVGVKTSEGVLIPHLNRTELARNADVGREYTSRHLSRLRQQGQIEMRNKGVLIRELTLGV